MKFNVGCDDDIERAEEQQVGCYNNTNQIWLIDMQLVLSLVDVFDCTLRTAPFIYLRYTGLTYALGYLPDDNTGGA